MLRQVEVCTAVDTFEFLEAEGKFEFDVRSGIGVVRQLFVVVEAVFFIPQTQCLVPGQTRLFPLLEPFHLLAGTDEELHFHLLELAHTEDELPGHDLVAERLADLCDTERNLHAAGFLHIEEIDEDTLGCFGTEIDGAHTAVHIAELGAEHQVELAHVGPVLGTGNRAGDLAVDYDLAEFLEVVVVQGLGHPGMDFVIFGLAAQYIGVGGTELLLVEGFAELAAALLHLLVHLFLELGQILFDEHVGAVAFLGILVVDERIVESTHVARGFPDTGVHENGGVDAHDVVVEVHHRFPPVTLDVILHLDAHLAVVIHGAQTIVDLAGLKNETILFGMRHERLEYFFLCHIVISFNNSCTYGRSQSWGWGMSRRSVWISWPLKIRMSMSIVRSWKMRRPSASYSA